MTFFDSIDRLPVSFRLALICCSALLFAAPFVRAVLGLQSPDAPPVRFRPRNVRLRTGTLNVMAIPLFGPVFELLDPKRVNAIGQLVWELGLTITIAAFVPLLYWFEVVHFGLGQEASSVLHVRFAAHLVLFLFLAAAFVEDKRTLTIGDWTTTGGTVFGIVLAAFLPAIAMPFTNLYGVTESVSHVAPWGRVTLRDACQPAALAWTLAAFGCFVYALTSRPKLRLFRPIRTVQVIGRRIMRALESFPLLMLLVAGSACILALYASATQLPVRHGPEGILPWTVGAHPWLGFRESLFGAVVGILLTWTFRTVMTCLFRQEAMGFGDVLLVGMIGSYLGWQATVVVFFLSCVTTAGILLVDAIVRKKREGKFRLPGGGEPFAFGPGIAVAAVLVIFLWPKIQYSLFAVLTMFGPLPR